jgi:hypothetical protein
MKDNELRKAIKELVAAQKETARQMKDTDKRMKETDERMKETDERMKETDLQLKRLGEQIGGLGNKFGTFTEGLILPSMSRVLHDRFGVDTVGIRLERRTNGRALEVDAFGWKKDTVFVVEIKSHLREDGLRRMIEVLKEFPKFFVEHRGKQLYGIIAAVDIPAQIRKKVLDAGIYLATIADETFRLDIPQGFVPKSFSS